MLVDSGDELGEREPRSASPQTQVAERMATQLAEQRVRVVELQRAAQQAIAREVASRVEQRTGARVDERDRRARAAALEAVQQQRVQVEAAQQRAIAQRTAESASAQQAQTESAGAGRACRPRRRVEQQQLQARIEERVAQRIAERTGTQRLHEQARGCQRATRVRTAPVAMAEVRGEPASARSSAASEAAIAAIAAAMSGPLAALAPELAAIVGARPERAAQVIGELSEALRAAELMSRATASGHAFETTRGPRVAMPAGLGGLVATVDRAHAVERPAGAVGTPIGPMGAMASMMGTRASVASPGMTAARTRDDLRVPTLAWVNAGGAPANVASGAPTSALGATAAASPQALQHVAWADRWLARFAGAAPASLDALDGASTMSPMVLGIASAAPSAVFVAPQFEAVRRAAAAADAAAATASAPAPKLMRASTTRSRDAGRRVRRDLRVGNPHARRPGGARCRGARWSAVPEPTLVVPSAPAPSDRGSYADAIAHTVPVGAERRTRRRSSRRRRSRPRCATSCRCRRPRASTCARCSAARCPRPTSPACSARRRTRSPACLRVFRGRRSRATRPRSARARAA